LEATALASAGHRAPSRLQAVRCYTEALSLLEGEPLSGVRHGFGWWLVEGHEPEVTRALVRAACDLATLSTDSGDTGLARWAIRRARLAEPDSEALSQAAMIIAAGRGDLDDLRRAWRECRHRLTRDDPELAEPPSYATECLYRRLTDQLRSNEPANEPPQASFAAMEEALCRTVPSAPAAL
jgi:hypothetical protein